MYLIFSFVVLSGIAFAGYRFVWSPLSEITGPWDADRIGDGYAVREETLRVSPEPSASLKMPAQDKPEDRKNKRELVAHLTHRSAGVPLRGEMLERLVPQGIARAGRASADVRTDPYTSRNPNNHAAPCTYNL